MRVVVQDTLRNEQWVAYDGLAGFTIGRGEECDISLSASRFVSRVHAQVDRGESGWEMHVDRRASSVRVDDDLVPPGSSAPLRPISQVRLAEFVLTLLQDEQQERPRQAGGEEDLNELQRELHSAVLRRLELRRAGGGSQLEATTETLERINDIIDDLLREEFQSRVFGSEATRRRLMSTVYEDRLVAALSADHTQAIDIQRVETPGVNIALEEAADEFVRRLAKRMQLGMSAESMEGDVEAINTRLREYLPAVVQETPGNVQMYLVARLLKKNICDMIFGPGPQPESLFALCNSNAAMVQCIHRFDTGSGSWIPVGPSQPNNEGTEVVFDMVAFDPDGPGPLPTRLYAAGTVFGTSRVAVYNPGTDTWGPIPGAPANLSNSNIYHGGLRVFNAPAIGANPALFIAKRFDFADGSAPLLTAYNGSGFTPISLPPEAEGLFAMEVLDGSPVGQRGPQLFLAGATPGAPRSSFATRYSGAGFVTEPALTSDSDSAFALPGEIITATGAWRPGTQTHRQLIVATEGPAAPGMQIEHSPFRRWNGAGFDEFPFGMFRPAVVGEPLMIRAIAEYDADGPGPAAPKLAVAGNFDAIFGDPALGLAIWNGSSWTKPVTTGPRPDIRCLVSMDILPGTVNAPVLFAGGSFATIDGVAASNAAFWNGSSWSAGGFSSIVGPVNAAAIFREPETPRKLVVGGEFTTPALYLAEYEFGKGFGPPAPPENPLDGPVDHLHPYSLFGGDAQGLIVGGRFSTAAGIQANGFAVYYGYGFWDAFTGLTEGQFVTAVGSIAQGSSGASDFFAVTSNLAGGRRLMRLDFSQGKLVFEQLANLGLPESTGRNQLITIDDDGYGPNPPSLVMTGDMPATVNGVATQGLIRYAGPAKGLVLSQFVSLTDDSFPSCTDELPGPDDTLIFDYGYALGMPGAQGFALLNGLASFGALYLRNSDVTIGLNFNELILTAPGYADGLVVGYGDSTFSRLTMTNVPAAQRGEAVSVFVNRAVVGGATNPGSAPQVLALESFAWLSSGSLLIAPSPSGGDMTLSDQSTLETGVSVRLADSPGAEGSLSLSGSSSWYGGGTELIIGGRGRGIVRIDADSLAQTTYGSTILGRWPGGEGVVEIGLGGGSYWQASGASFVVGDHGAGHISLIGSELTVNNAQIFLGREPTGHGSISVEGSGGILRTPDGIIAIGLRGSGEVHIRDGGVANSVGGATSVTLGAMPGASGLLRLSAINQAANWLGGVGTTFHVGPSDGGAGEIRLESNPTEKSLTAYAVLNANSVLIGRNGLLSGTGILELQGEVNNRGLVSPRGGETYPTGQPTTGFISISGGYSQLSAAQNQGIPGRLAVDIASPMDYDSIDATGSVTLGGNLDVAFVNNFRPAPGELGAGLPILFSKSGINGRFEVATFPGLAPDSPGGLPRFLRVEYGADTRGFPAVFIVEATLDAPPPEAGAGQDYTVGGAGTSAALGDLNGNGLLDIVITIPDSTDPVNNPGSIVILYNGGSIDGFWQGFTSSVQITVAPNPSAVAIGDFDGVLGNDIVFTSATNGTFSIMRNDGTRSFAPPAARRCLRRRARRGHDHPP